MDRSIEEAAAGRTTGTIGSVRPSRVRTDLRGAFASVAALVGLLIGIRAVVDPGRDGVRALLGLPDIPRDRIGVLWSDSALWPGDAQAGALERLGALLASLLLAAAVVALVGSLLHLFEAGASRRRELALRAAVGAGPRALLLHAARSLRTLALAGGALGILLGLSAGALLRGLWPGTLAAVGWVDAAAWAPVLVAPLALLALAYLRTAWRLARGALLAPALLDGGRSTSGRGDAARRRVVPALQMGVAGAVVIGTWALLGAGTRAGPLAGDTPAGAVAIPVSAAGPVTPERWSDTLMRIAGLPGVEAGTLASPGALVGLGVRDHALAHCGACVRGGLPLPFWGAFADHHAVAPGFFSAAGMTVAEGRDLGPGDGPDAPRVALVNRTFADRAFERGRPIGKRVRLGATLHDWYTVVGVVEDFTTPVVGGDDVDRAAVWVSALQRAPSAGHVLVVGSGDGVAAARDVLAADGFAPGDPIPVSELRRAAARPLRWASRVALALCLLTLLLALHGARTTALLIARRRIRELAVRRVLGATDHKVLVHVLAGAARSGAWGAALAVFGGSLLVALLRKAAGGVPAPGPVAYAAVVGLLVGASLVAAVRAGREALAVEPAAVVD